MFNFTVHQRSVFIWWFSSTVPEPKFEDARIKKKVNTYYVCAYIAKKKINTIHVIETPCKLSSSVRPRTIHIIRTTPLLWTTASESCLTAYTCQRFYKLRERAGQFPGSHGNEMFSGALLLKMKLMLNNLGFKKKKPNHAELTKH
jgi:hypothetical protein